MRYQAGFTLVETLVAVAVLLLGVILVAGLFSYSVGTNVSARQTTTAVFLAGTKLEELRAVPLEDLVAGGGLDPDSPVIGYWEFVSVASDGTVTTDTVTAGARFLQMWEIGGTNPKTVTVIVFSLGSTLGRKRSELLRASTRVALRF